MLGGKAGAGKTQMLRAICVAKGWPCIFASTIDELRGARVPPKQTSLRVILTARIRTQAGRSARFTLKMPEPSKSATVMSLSL